MNIKLKCMLGRWRDISRGFLFDIWSFTAPFVHIRVLNGPEWYSQVMRRYERWNILQTRPRRDLNSDGWDLCYQLDHGVTLQVSRICGYNWLIYVLSSMALKWVLTMSGLQNKANISRMSVKPPWSLGHIKAIPTECHCCLINRIHSTYPTWVWRLTRPLHVLNLSQSVLKLPDLQDTFNLSRMIAKMSGLPDTLNLSRMIIKTSCSKQ